MKVDIVLLSKIASGLKPGSSITITACKDGKFQVDHGSKQLDQKTPADPPAANSFLQPKITSSEDSSNEVVVDLYDKALIQIPLEPEN